MKKLFSLVAALVMCCAMWADPVDTLYLNTGGSSLWNQAGAKFSAYYWNDGEEGQFTDFLELAIGETDIYRAIIPQKDSVIFVRHNSTADVPTWDNKWNQTDGEKVEIEDSGNILIIKGWDQGNTEWDHYTPKAPGSIKIYAKNNWAGGDWSWKEMKHDSTTIYSLEDVFGGIGININSKAGDADALWFDATKMAYTADTIKANDTVKIVFNLADSTLTATLLSRPVPPCVDNFGLMIDGSYVPGVYKETSSEWTVLKQDLIAGQKLMMYSYCGETSFAPKQGNYTDFFDVDGDTLIVKEDAEYDFYIQLITGNDKLWVVQRKTVTLPRITKAPKSWAGEYAIAAMANDTALVWTGVDAAYCRDSIKLVDGNLVAQDPVMVVVEAMKDGGYSVKVKGGTNDGKYISSGSTAPSYSNALKFVDNPVRVDISMKDSLVDFFQTINTQKVYLLYNKTKGSSGERFRFYKETNYGGSSYRSLALFGTPAPSYDYDTVMYVAGNFTNWAEGMKVLPDTVTMPVDSVLKFKQVRVITTKLGETVIKTDTAWFGQQSEGAYMTRENSKDGWTLDGAYDVLLLTDRAGDYVFCLEGESFKVKFPALPGYTYDTVYSIAGNFTNWQEDMQKMPYEVKNVAKDSVLLYKVVRQLITYETGVETKRDTTWLGQPNEGNQMTRESNAWKLDGGENVKLTADEDGTYKFDFTPADSVLTVTFPDIKPHLDEVNTIANIKACYEAGTLKDNDTIRVKGYIASMFLKPNNFAKYGSVTFWMTDTLGGKAKEFQLYNCYGLEKDTFVYFGPGYNTTSKSNIDVDTIIGRNNVRFVLGDYIEAVGTFKNYSGTFELVQGCNIYEGGEKMVRFAKNNWDAAETWTWEEMTYVPQKNLFELNKVVYGGTGVNINTVADDAEAVWIAEANFLGDKVQAKDTVSFVFNQSDSTLTATLIGRPVGPTPAVKKYYITGDSALVGDKAWKADALEMKDSTHTFMAIAAGSYKMKVTDGTWENNWGYAALTEASSEGLSGDGDGNICFTVEVPNNVVVSIANGQVTVTGTFKKEPAPEVHIYAKNNWDNADPNNWTWKEMTKGENDVYTLESVVFGGQGLNVNSKEEDADARWYALEDIEGDNIAAKDTVKFVFNLSDSTLTATLIGRPYVPVITHDTTMYVAGNFTNWAAGMQKLPYTANLPEDSVLKFKQVRVVVTLHDGEAVKKDTTWYGTPGTEPMTRESSTWLLDGENDVTLTTDVAGDYKFELVAETGEMKVTWPEKPATKLDIVMKNGQLNKVVVNGQLYIIRNNVLYNANGARVK